MLPVFRPSTGEEEAAAVAEVLKSGWIGQGPRTAEFEREFARYLGVPSAVALNSCTAALELAMTLLDIGPGDEVIVPPMTFISTAHVVVRCGATPVFVDVDPLTLSLDPDAVERAITPRTKAVMAVHYAGRPVDVRSLRRRLDQRIAVVEDCAHAAGARYYGHAVGSEANLSCFSFHAVKNLAMGDGGALICRDADEDARARRLRWLGIDRDTWTRNADNRRYWWRYNVDEIGSKCHMNDISAAIGLVQLRKLDAANARRRQIVSRYNQLLDGIVALPPDDTPELRSSWHIYCIRCRERDDLAAHLAEQGISTGVHYYPIHLYPCYRSAARLPVAEQAFERILTLPLFPQMADADVERVCAAITGFARSRGGNLVLGA